MQYTCKLCRVDTNFKRKSKYNTYKWGLFSLRNQCEGHVLKFDFIYSRLEIWIYLSGISVLP